MANARARPNPEDDTGSKAGSKGCKINERDLFNKCIIPGCDALVFLEITNEIIGLAY